MINQNNFTKLLCIAIIFVLSGELFATNSNLNIEKGDSKISQQISEIRCNEVMELNLLVDCTIRIKNDNGTDLTVTFHDISIFQCAKIKIGKWLRDIF